MSNTQTSNSFALISVSEAARQTDNKQVWAKESGVRLPNAYVEVETVDIFYLLYTMKRDKEQNIFRG